MDEKETFVDALGLTLKQTEILYNFQMLKTEADIRREKDGDKAILKILWKNKWSKSMEGIFSKYRNDSQQKLHWYSESELRSITKQEFSDSPSKIWYYLAVLEADFFEPYFPLHVQEEQDKKGKSKVVVSKEFNGLKFDKKYDWLSAFVGAEGLIEVDFITRIRKAYTGTYNRLSGKVYKYVVTAVVFSTVGFGAAALFAGRIAVALVGHLFSGLHGAALVNACLAYLGGGAIAAGGAGIAGGAAVVAGGGAVLGMGAGSAIFGGANSLGLLSNPKLALPQIARLEVTMKEIILNSQKDVRLAQTIIEHMQNVIVTTRLQLDQLDSEVKKNKEQISNLKKSLELLKNARKHMNQFCSSFAEGVASDPSYCTNN